MDGDNRGTTIEHRRIEMEKMHEINARAKKRRKKHRLFLEGIVGAVHGNRLHARKFSDLASERTGNKRNNLGTMSQMREVAQQVTRIAAKSGPPVCARVDTHNHGCMVTGYYSLFVIPADTA